MKLFARYSLLTTLHSSSEVRLFLAVICRPCPADKNKSFTATVLSAYETPICISYPSFAVFGCLRAAFAEKRCPYSKTNNQYERI